MSISELLKYFIPLILFFIPLTIISRQFSQKYKLRKKNYEDTFFQLNKEYEDKKIQLQKIKEKIFSKEKEIKRVTYLYELIKRMAKILTWDEMLKLLKKAIKEYLNLSVFLFFIPERRQGDVSLSFSLVLREEFFFDEDSIKRYFTNEALLSYAKEKKAKIVQVDKEKMLFLPFYREDETLGLLWAKVEEPSTMKVWQPEEGMITSNELISEAENLASELILGLEKVKLYTAVEEMSRFDGLTGLYRRYYFETRLAEEIVRIRRYSGVFSVSLIDIDYFKKCNDTYGHQVGDQILQRLGKILKENLYETDIIARYGGEEFVILFPRAEPEGVKRKMENLREKIAAEDFILDWGKLKITVSIGLAHYPRDGPTAEEILRAADQSLYFSKQRGRNCLSEYSETLAKNSYS
jgi:diguanylate cyclase (GGDEF)-like protein